MKSGAVNIVTNPGQGLSADISPLERQEDGEVLRSMIELVNSHQATFADLTVDDGDLKATSVDEGTVYREELIEYKSRRLDEDGNLQVDNEGIERQVNETQFIHAAEQVLLTQSTTDDTAREIIEALSSSVIEEAKIDIQSFAAAHPEADPVLEWGPDTQQKLNAICGVGDLSTDTQIRNRLDRSDSAQLSFEGLQWDGRSLYGTVTNSGYVEIYRDENGGDIGTLEFTRFVLDEVTPHASVAN